ncbi:MAG: ATP-dependent RecD-like DNA helicase [Desulfurivibrionaceae bacterium]
MPKRPAQFTAPQNETPAEQLSGVLERITFHSEATGFTVARLQPDDPDSEPVTVVGVLSDAPVGSSLELTGRWQRDPRHGRQFKFDGHRIVKPTTIKGMEKYLGSGLIKGVGPVNAARIVKHFGTDTLEVLDHNPERLSEVRGLGSKLAARIKETWLEQQDIHEIMIFLQGHDISAAYAVKIYKNYGRKALRVVKENPYRLIEDIRGVGFKIADRIAVSVGLPRDDPARIKAGLLFVLNEAMGRGHCYLERAELFAAGRVLLEVPAAMVEAGLPELAGAEQVVISGERVYLGFLYQAELGAAKSLVRIGDGPAPWGKLDPAAELQKIRGKIGFELADEQAEALGLVLASRLAVLTGGPGTGKSTILKAMMLMLEGKGVRILLAAPTGRAAKRLAEAAGRNASTIHRLLEFSAFEGGFSRNGDNPLEVDLLVVDEVSMLDIVLANALLRAVPTGAAVLLVGDGDQLPAVGPGNFLKDIIEWGAAPVARLTRIFRQQQGSLISVNGARVNNGDFFDLLPGYRGEKDFYYINRDNLEEIEKEIVSLCGGRLAEKYGYDPMRDIQVLTPMRKGLIGVENLNLRLQEVLNRAAPGEAADFGSGGRFRRGDKVMQLRNNYEKEVFNGDLGFVTGIDGDDRVMTVEFDDRPVRYGFGEVDELQLAYAVTVHKAQGSEFPCVIFPVHTAHYPLLQRNLLYTGITRGRKLVIVIGSRKALSIAIANDRLQTRNSGLMERLRERTGDL